MELPRRNNGFRKVAKWIVGAAVVAGASHGIVMAQEETPKIPEVPEEMETKTEVPEVPEGKQTKTEVTDAPEEMETKTEVPEVPEGKQTKTEVTKGKQAIKLSGWSTFRSRPDSGWYVDTIKPAKGPLPDILTFHQRNPLDKMHLKKNDDKKKKQQSDNSTPN
ncbi:hypothetical protein BBOV_III005590 [Babesia bovis T2Bo]|uniref:Uncharacterized protein n=1 Tax=Babesia bovis TaxID=5865 RepID=A7ANI8_BABBO|nr:hypothetical protein BBOV_III005590 [Babesia bovis T2Bo]EDO08122.1 hypothetical protein BBOV_III005590 [Babesia bovis T2Bo]|eukprot:XP_001611690.1 hypothetical protein [Babesia bovis T2Bo]